MGLAYRMASRIDGLMLVCPMVKDLGERELPKHEVRVSDRDLLAQLTPEEQEGISWSAVQTERVFNRVKAEMGTSSTPENERFLTKLQEEGYTFSFDFEDATVPFTKPTLIVTGRQDSAVGYKDAWSTLDRFPKATYAVLDRAGHELPISQDKLLDALLNEWLDRVEEEAVDSGT
jgi:pimeloyl-ACP methyl ester carboxylesterase